MILSDHVDKKKLLTFLEERIREMKYKLERAEQRQEQAQAAEFYYKKFTYEDLHVRIARGDFDPVAEVEAGAGEEKSQ